VIELDDSLHRRSPPAVQGLVLVADAEQPVVRGGEYLHERFLRRLDVLVLIHQHLRVLALPAVADLRVGAQRADGPQQQVVEVIAALLGEMLLVEPVQVQQRLLLVVVGVGQLGVLVGADHRPKLEVGDHRLRERRLDPAAVLARGALRERQQPPPLAEAKSEDLLVPQQPLGAHELVADPVESLRFDVADAGGGQALLQLNPCVAVERGAQDPVGRKASAQQLADAFDQHRGLA
jgi:hypothetical protein